MKRKIIQINEELCNGCGKCIPNCPEGALQIIDGKARLISDIFCDGFGACLGECPLGAIELIEREAEPYDERKAMENIVRQGKNVIIAHLKHLKEHGEIRLFNEAIQYLTEKGIDNPLTEEHSHYQHSCPSSKAISLKKKESLSSSLQTRSESFLENWPVQLKLINPLAPYLKNAHILLCADCVPFAYANFHADFVKERVVIILCPKLDGSIDDYIEKLTEITRINEPQFITVVHMEVPCCFGIVHIAKEASKRVGRNIEMNDVTISIDGSIKEKNI